MQTYEIKGDLSEQRHSHLGFILGGTLIVGILLYAFSSVSGTPAMEPWLCLAGALAVAYQLRRRSNHSASGFSS
jgi:hypothetical protein